MLTLFLSAIDTPGGQEMLTELYMGFRQTLYRCALGILESAANAEDAVHDVFLYAAGEGADRLMRMDETERKRFLFVCTRNRALNMVKKRGKLVSLEALREDGLQIPDEGSAEEPAAEAAALEAAREELLKMDPRYSDPLFLHLEGWTNAQIAAAFGEKEETVRKRIYRGKLLLRRAVEESGVIG